MHWMGNRGNHVILFEEKNQFNSKTQVLFLPQFVTRMDVYEVTVPKCVLLLL